MSQIEDIRNSYDWDHIFKNYTQNPHNPLTRAPAGRDYGLGDIARVVAYDDGENDGDNWIGLFEMTDGRFLSVSAGCDYTGWGCQEAGGSEWTATEAEAIAALTPEERSRLKLGA